MSRIWSRSELVAEAGAHLVFVRAFDHAAAEDSFESERRQVDRRALIGQNQLGHRRSDRRRSFESRTAEAGCDEQRVDTGHRTHHGARVGADIVNAGVTARIRRVGHRGDSLRQPLAHGRDEVGIVALAKIVRIRLRLWLPSTESCQREIVAMRAKVTARNRIYIDAMFKLRRAFEECNLRALALDTDLHTQWRKQCVGPGSRHDAYRVALVKTAGLVHDSRGASTAIRNSRD